MKAKAKKTKVTSEILKKELNTLFELNKKRKSALNKMSRSIIEKKEQEKT